MSWNPEVGQNSRLSAGSTVSAMARLLLFATVIMMNIILRTAYSFKQPCHGLCRSSRPIQARSSRNGESNSQQFYHSRTHPLQALAFLLSVFASPSYNLPIFLFGCYAQENTEALQSLQTVSNVQSTNSCFPYQSQIISSRGYLASRRYSI